MVFTLRDLNVRGPVKVPRGTVMAHRAVPTWRWVTLLAVVGVFAHHKIHARLDGPTLESLLATSGTSLLPVHSVFTIWGTILLVLVGYGVAQLTEGQRQIATHDRIGRYVVLAAALASLQLVTLALRDIYVTAAITTALAAVAGAAYVRVVRGVRDGTERPWVGIPFALLLGFTGVAAIASIDGAILAAGGPSSAPAIALLLGAGVAAIYLGLDHRDAALPAFVAWVLTAICAANRSDTTVASAALLAGAVCAATAVLIAATRLDRPPATSGRTHALR